jgi:ABC-type branched-subunit amino acid transport system substrate-binding protein
MLLSIRQSQGEVWSMRSRWVALAATAALVAAGCGNAKSNAGGGGTTGGTTGGTGGAETQGITSTEIKVGSLASITGPLGNQYAPVADGAEAYLDMINAHGGVDGRKIVMVAKLDDQTNPTRDISQAQALDQQYKVFALVGVATPLFPAGTWLGQNNVPTFGWNVNPEWAKYPSLFGEKGSYLDFTGTAPTLPWLAQKLGVKKVGVLAYNVSQSQDCATGTINSWKKFGFDPVFEDSSLPFGTTNIDADIQRMKQSGVQLMATCMDPTGNVLLARGAKEANLHIMQYWPNGYDQSTLHQYGSLMNGVYLAEGFTPFQSASTSPGMQTFLQQMKTYFPNEQISEVQLAGWLDANMFVDGLKAVGKNLTRSKLINAVNSISNFTGNGIWSSKSPIDWKVAHTARSPGLDCSAFIQVQNQQFVPVFGTASDPFICLNHFATTLPH